MAKRMTDTDKWKKTWFRKLCPKCKCFWMYVLDNCDYSGIWEVDFELASMFIGEDLNESFIIEQFKKQYQKVKGGKQWFIPDFISFQYGELLETNRMHRSVINLLKKHGVYKGYKHPLEGDKEQDKEQDKDKDKVYNKENNKEVDFIDELKSNPAYKHISVETELNKMDAWLLAHKGRKKTKRFVVNWLNKIEVPLEIKKQPIRLRST